MSVTAKAKAGYQVIGAEDVFPGSYLRGKLLPGESVTAGPVKIEAGHGQAVMVYLRGEHLLSLRPDADGERVRFAARLPRPEPQRSAITDPPLVRLGQGDYVREIRESDV